MLKKILPFILALMAMPFFMMAQSTTSSITGVVKNASGTPLSGASITATHIPTGTVYSTSSRTGGRFDINNMNPGGPYKITATFVGFSASNQEDVFLTLGETQRTDFGLKDNMTELAEVIVAGTRSIGNKSGSETQIGRDKIMNVPSVGRNLNDFIRFTP